MRWQSELHVARHSIGEVLLNFFVETLTHPTADQALSKSKFLPKSAVTNRNLKNLH